MSGMICGKCGAGRTCSNCAIIPSDWESKKNNQRMFLTVNGIRKMAHVVSIGPDAEPGKACNGDYCAHWQQHGDICVCYAPALKISQKVTKGKKCLVIAIKEFEETLNDT